MKKPSSLAQQVQQAQRTVESWPDSLKSTLHLEGSDVFLTRNTSDNKTRQQTQTGDTKKKAIA
jgi:hypothetical protein